MTPPELAALGVAALGCAADLHSRRIPNALTLGAAASAIIFHGVTSGVSGAVHAAGGWLVGLALFLPLFALRGLGGGDVKLLAALGAWLGPWPTLWLAFWTAIVGGPLALVVAFGQGYLGQALRNIWGLLMFWRVAGLRPHPALNLDVSGAPRLPYAVPIAVGLVVTLWAR
jgi:prepilin peptidase CpaA